MDDGDGDRVPSTRQRHAQTRLEELADLVLALASSRLGGVTCSNAVIDGGLITTH